MYTDDSLLTFGKHKFTKLFRVPPDYLLELHKTRQTHDKELLKYIDENYQTILDRRDGKIVAPPLEIGFKFSGRKVDLICKDTSKIIFPSKKEGKHELKRIQNFNGEQKKPVRAYECSKCGGWHLTSLPFEVWEKRIDDSRKNDTLN